jgi:hypothetical protein
VLGLLLSACDDSGVNTPVVSNAAVKFTKTYGSGGSEILSQIIHVNSGGFLLGGYTSSSGAGGNDMLLTKISASGDVTWSKTFGGTGDDECLSVLETGDGGFVAAGQTNSFGAEGLDIYVVRVNADGGVIWSNIYKLPGDQFGLTILKDTDGGFVVCGNTNQNAGSNGDILVLTIAADGTFLSQSVYGSPMNDFAYRTTKTSDGGFLITASSFGFSTVNGDAYLIKLKANHSLEWSSTYGGDQYDVANEVAENSGHDLVVVGYTRSFGLTDGDILVFKIDHNGFVYTSEGWPRTIGSTFGRDEANSVVAASDGSFYVTGYVATSATDEDIFFVHYFGNSVYDYSRSYGSANNNDKGVSIIPAGTGYVIGGITASYGAGGNDMMIIGMNADSTGRYSACLTGSAFTPNGGSPANFNAVPVTTETYITQPAQMIMVTTVVGTAAITANVQCGQ